MKIGAIYCIIFQGAQTVWVHPHLMYLKSNSLFDLCPNTVQLYRS
jgi:hypothetical protein